MKNQYYFRIVNRFEENIIIDTLSKISHKISTILDTIDYTLCIVFYESSSKINFPSIYLAPNNLLKIIDKLGPNAGIISAGIYFGFIKRNNFLLSLEGAEFIWKLNSFSDSNLVKVNTDGEKAILYGNKLQKKMILQLSNDTKMNDFLLIFNKTNELICIAQSQVNFGDIKNLTNHEIVALNLVDKGYYLRKKQ